MLCSSFTKEMPASEWVAKMGNPTGFELVIHVVFELQFGKTRGIDKEGLLKLALSQMNQSGLYGISHKSNRNSESPVNELVAEYIDLMLRAHQQNITSQTPEYFPAAEARKRNLLEWITRHPNNKDEGVPGLNLLLRIASSKGSVPYDNNGVLILNPVKIKELPAGD